MSGNCQASEKQTAPPGGASHRGRDGRDRRSDSRQAPRPPRRRRAAGFEQPRIGRLERPLDQQRLDACAQFDAEHPAGMRSGARATHPGREPIALAGLRVECDAEFPQLFHRLPHRRARHGQIRGQRVARDGRRDRRAAGNPLWQRPVRGRRLIGAGARTATTCGARIDACAHAPHVAPVRVDHEHGAGHRESPAAE